MISEPEVLKQYDTAKRVFYQLKPLRQNLC